VIGSECVAWGVWMLQGDWQRLHGVGSRSALTMMELSRKPKPTKGRPTDKATRQRLFGLGGALLSPPSFCAALTASLSASKAARSSTLQHRARPQLCDVENSVWIHVA
jgi:hypothetical protein